MSINETTSYSTIEEILSIMEFEFQGQLKLLSETAYNYTKFNGSVARCESINDTNIVPKDINLRDNYFSLIHFIQDNNNFYRAIVLHSLLNLFNYRSTTEIQYFIRKIYQYFNKKDVDQNISIQFKSSDQQLHFLDINTFSICFLKFLVKWLKHKNNNQQNKSISQLIIEDINSNADLNVSTIIIFRNLFLNTLRRFGLSNLNNENQPNQQIQDIENNLLNLEDPPNSYVLSLASETLQCKILLELVDEQIVKATQYSFRPFVNECANIPEITLMLLNNQYYIISNKKLNELNVKPYTNLYYEQTLALTNKSMVLDILQSQGSQRMLCCCNVCYEMKEVMEVDDKYLCQECSAVYLSEKSSICNQQMPIEYCIPQSNDNFVKKSQNADDKNFILDALKINGSFVGKRKAKKFYTKNCIDCQQQNQNEPTYLVQQQHFCQSHINLKVINSYPGKVFNNIPIEEFKLVYDLISSKLIDQICTNCSKEVQETIFYETEHLCNSCYQAKLLNKKDQTVENNQNPFQNQQFNQNPKNDINQNKNYNFQINQQQKVNYQAQQIPNNNQYQQNQQIPQFIPINNQFNNNFQNNLPQPFNQFQNQNNIQQQQMGNNDQAIKINFNQNNQNNMQFLAQNYNPFTAGVQNQISNRQKPYTYQQNGQFNQQSPYYQQQQNNFPNQGNPLNQPQNQVNYQNNQNPLNNTLGQNKNQQFQFQQNNFHLSLQEQQQEIKNKINNMKFQFNQTLKK